MREGKNSVDTTAIINWLRCAFRGLVNDVVIREVYLREILTSFSQAAAKIISVEVFLHVLTSFLELSDDHFLALVQIRGVCLSSPIVLVTFSHVGVPASGAATSHALHIEDSVGVDDGDDGDHDQARASGDEQ